MQSIQTLIGDSTYWIPLWLVLGPPYPAFCSKYFVSTLWHHPPPMYLLPKSWTMFAKNPGESNGRTTIPPSLSLAYCICRHHVAVISNRVCRVSMAAKYLAFNSYELIAVPSIRTWMWVSWFTFPWLRRKCDFDNVGSIKCRARCKYRWVCSTFCMVRPLIPFTGGSALAVIWTLVCLASIVVFARLWTQARVTYQLGLSDILMAISLVSTTSICVCPV